MTEINFRQRFIKELYPTLANPERYKGTSSSLTLLKVSQERVHN